MAKITTRPMQPAMVPPNEHVLVVSDHELQMIERGLLWDTHCKSLPTGGDDNEVLYGEVSGAMRKALVPKLL
jgi:hypothetical protein